MAELEQKKVSNEKGLEVGDPELARLALQLQMTRSPGFDHCSGKSCERACWRLYVVFPQKGFLKKRTIVKEHIKVRNPLHHLRKKRDHSDDEANPREQVHRVLLIVW